MTSLDQQHYNVGWNDTAHGINDWVTHPNWNNPLEWAIHIEKLARKCQLEAKGSHNKAYFQGVIDCVKQYLETGKVSETHQKGGEAHDS